MSNIKFYTEEQVKKAISIDEYGDYECEQIIDELTPIELPNDEEIDKATPLDTSNSYEIGIMYGFEQGAKWIKEQILNQKINNL